MAAGSQHSEASGRPAPLAGMRVVELATFISGPYATMMLADLGAEVVKVEPAAGDPFRRFGRPATEYSVAFATSNRGKRSVVLDLKSADSVGTLLRLLAASDILVCNWRPGVAERLGLGDDLLAGANEKLIRIYITGFGADGPLRDEPAFDTVVQGRSGMTRALSPSDTPVLLPGYPVDKLTAMMAVQAALAAVVGRRARRPGRAHRPGHARRRRLLQLRRSVLQSGVRRLPARRSTPSATAWPPGPSRPATDGWSSPRYPRPPSGGHAGRWGSPNGATNCSPFEIRWPSCTSC